ncbi:MAG: hypothetical protein P8Y70_14255 [Candidatus Lokiarchaeota archaeon]
MPLTLIITECGLELIPKKIRTHSAVKRNFSKKLYASQLLDTAIHHSAMTKLSDSNKRGRPDILHLCLLNALGSILNKTGNLELYFHTYKDRIFKLNPEIRISKNYNRFKGLMANLLIDGVIKADNKILINEIKNSEIGIQERDIMVISEKVIANSISTGASSCSSQILIKSISRSLIGH